ncbi:MAG: diaminopimelate epimerase [Candidatus Sericytochromatia bacterium]|nr:diaminopimelate epimerase [Candidatus Sericytochromatia bacterium]
MTPAAFPPPHAWARMEGLGNDFIVVHADTPGAALPAAAEVRELCDRHLGLGGDGLLWLVVEGDGTPRMTVLNADGSRAAMCGNGLRCAALYLTDRGLAPRDAVFAMQTDSGPRRVKVRDADWIEAWLEVPGLQPDQLPANPSVAHASRVLASGATQMQLDDGTPWGTVVSMGNPHLVVLDPDWSREQFFRTGHDAQHHPALPEGVNLGWARLSGPDSLDLEVWERGVGPTRACGTGAAAAAVAASLARERYGTWLVRQPGGILHCRWPGPDQPVIQVGPARWIATGTWPPVPRSR